MRKELYDDHCCHFYDLKIIHLGQVFFVSLGNVLKVLAILLDGKTKQEKH